MPNGVKSPSPADPTMRWRRVSYKAGVALEQWYNTKVPALFRGHLKVVLKYAAALKRADIDEIERLLSGTKG